MVAEERQVISHAAQVVFLEVRDGCATVHLVSVRVTVAVERERVCFGLGLMCRGAHGISSIHIIRAGRHWGKQEETECNDT